MITKVFYSVENMMDGSAYPQFFESEKCSDFHQYLLNEYGEGWGEDCVGKLEIESDGPIKVKGVITDLQYIADLKQTLTWSKGERKREIEEFIFELEVSINKIIE